MEPDEIKPTLSRIALISLILGNIGFLTSLLWMILLIFYPNFIDIQQIPKNAERAIGQRRVFTKINRYDYGLSGIVFVYFINNSVGPCAK